MIKNLMKTVALLLAFSCFSINAATQVYMGVSLGGAFTNLDKTVIVNNPVPISPMPTIFSRESAVNGFLGGIYFGLERYFQSNKHAELNHFSASAEINLMGSTAESITRINNIPGMPPQNIYLSEKMPFTITLSVLPGYFITDTTKVYLRFSLVESLLRSVSADAGREGYTGSFSNFIVGGQIGIGFEVFFSKHCSLRAEYDFTGYETLTRTAHSTIVGNTVTTKYCPHVHQVLFSASYHL